jgi:hypothetical protein
MPHRTPCTYGADDRARRFVTHRTPCMQSADDRARIFVPRRTLCTESADDRARRFPFHRTPCIESADDRADKRCTPCTPSGTSPRADMAPLCKGLSSASRPALPHPHHPATRPRPQPSQHHTLCMNSVYDRARRLIPHRTPYTESAHDHARRLHPHRTPCILSADDRAHRFVTHRTPCNDGANDRADKRCTPCSSSGTSPRARMAPSCKELSSASCPALPHPQHPAARPRPQPRRAVFLGRVANASSSPPRPPTGERNEGGIRAPRKVISKSYPLVPFSPPSPSLLTGGGTGPRGRPVFTTHRRRIAPTAVTGHIHPRR